MALKYALYKNHFTKQSDQNVALTLGNPSIDREGLIDRMIRSGSTVTKSEALSVLEEYSRAIEEYVSEGYPIATPLFHFSHSISGVFPSGDGTFNPETHKVHIKIRPGKRLIKASKGIETECIEWFPYAPLPLEFKDVSSDTINLHLTAGGVGELKGRRLKYDANDSQQGAFFIHSSKTEFRVTKLIRNKPSNLIFINPEDMPKGSYRLELRNLFRHSKDLRSGGLPDLLSLV
jgi:DNA-binding domain/Domain of unknown function (DUF4469) with IG-like fold